MHERRRSNVVFVASIFLKLHDVCQRAAFSLCTNFNWTTSSGKFAPIYARYRLHVFQNVGYICIQCQIEYYSYVWSGCFGHALSRAPRMWIGRQMGWDRVFARSTAMGICFANPANRESSMSIDWAFTICQVSSIIEHSSRLRQHAYVLRSPGFRILSGFIWRYVVFGNHFACVFAKVIPANRESSSIIDLEYDSRVCVIRSPGFEPHYLSGVIWRYVFLAAISHVYLQQ